MSTRFEPSRGRARSGLVRSGVLAGVLAAVLSAVLAVGATTGTATAAGDQAASGQAATGRAPDARTVTLFPGRLARGADTSLLHMEEEVIVDGDLRIPVRGPAHMWMMGRIGRAYLVMVAGEQFEGYSVQLVERNGDRRVLQRFGDRTTATASADGRHLALTTLVRRDTRIRVVRTLTGEVVRERTFAAYGAEISDYGHRRMVIGGIRGGRTYWWNPVTNRLRLIVAKPAGADISADRLVVMLWDRTPPYRNCQRTVRLSRPNDVIWRSCREIPLKFSPDATRMVTMAIDTDGIGPRELRVRRAGGALLQTYQAPMWFGFVEWESNTKLLLQPVGRHHVAAVRCDPVGTCERASRLYEAPGTFDPPQTMRWSFPQ